MNKISITFYTLRHAITTYNENKLFTGWHNPTLSNTGIEQAKRLNLSNYSIISSDHQRCIQTLQYANITDFDVDCRLREVNLGVYSGKPIHNIKEYQLHPLDYSPPKGESYRLAYYRLSSLLFELFYRLSISPSANYLLCTSSGIIRILKALEYKPLLEDFHSLKTKNCYISKHTLNVNDFYYLSKQNN